MNEVKPAKRMQNVKASPTLKLNALAKSMQKEGIDVVNLTAGETDFATDPNVIAAAIEAMNGGQTRYTPSNGILELRKEIVNWFQSRWGLNYTDSQVTVSCGIKQGLFNLIMALVGEGDEVVIPSPYWVSYPAMVDLAGGSSVIVKTNPVDGFRLDPESIKKAITNKTKLLILNAPNNPTGAMIRKADLEAIAKLLEGTEILVASDEIYAELSYQQSDFCSFASISPDAYQRTITLNGLSKSHAMTGWRVGFLAGEEKVIKAVNVIQGQSVSNITSFVQPAAIEALKQSKESLSEMRTSLQKRRDLSLKILADAKDIILQTPGGAFYCFPDISAYFQTKSPNGLLISDSEKMSEYLLSEAKVASVPGSAFGEDRCIRLSFATDEKSLEKGMKRVVSALQNLQS